MGMAEEQQRYRQSADSGHVSVAIGRCPSYEQRRIDGVVDELLTALNFKVARSSRVLLKPNLVAASTQADLACSHPSFVAAVARWFVEQGARVVVGDSPATGSALQVMRITGITTALRDLPVTFAPFRKTCTCRTRGGLEVTVARDALECDYFINLPKVKSHGQLAVSLAMKNYYGIVKGWRKAWGHQIHGRGDAAAFFNLLVDLPRLVPEGLSLCDGIMAMHVSGPMHGTPYPLGIMAASRAAPALDRALLEVIGLPPQRSPLWCAGHARGDHGHDLEQLFFPLLRPGQVQVPDFVVPDHLQSVPFGVGHVVGSLAGRFRVWLECYRGRGGQEKNG
ncbi:MAG: hypothetical protein C0613_01805 [Desulfobulbaceae bacterium]|nr:MAG: hypothetical protein C0613_01805 [Desulfobulbaceae bacterium]